MPEEVDREVDWGVLGMYFASAALGWPRIGGGCRARKGSRSWTRQKCRSRGRDSSAFKNARRRRRCRLSSKSVAQQRSRSGTTPNLASAACLPTALSKLIHDLDLKWIGWLCCAAPYPQAHSALIYVISQSVSCSVLHLWVRAKLGHQKMRSYGAAARRASFCAD